MRVRLGLVMALSLPLLLVCPMAAPCRADTGSDLKSGQDLMKAGKYDDAIVLFSSVVSSQPPPTASPPAPSIVKRLPDGTLVLLSRTVTEKKQEGDRRVSIGIDPRLLPHVQQTESFELTLCAPSRSDAPLLLWSKEVGFPKGHTAELPPDPRISISDVIVVGNNAYVLYAQQWIIEWRRKGPMMRRPTFVDVLSKSNSGSWQPVRTIWVTDVSNNDIQSNRAVSRDMHVVSSEFANKDTVILRLDNGDVEQWSLVESGHEANLAKRTKVTKKH